MLEKARDGKHSSGYTLVPARDEERRISHRSSISAVSDTLDDEEEQARPEP